MDAWTARSKWRNFSRELEMNIRYLHVFEIEEDGSFGALFVTMNDKVYGVGCNGRWRLLGVSRQNEMVEPEKEVKRLSGQRVACISVGGKVGAARTADGKIFHWGRDLQAPGEGDDDVETVETREVHQPDGSAVHHCVDVACGSMFVAALTREHLIILWGSIAGKAAVVYGHVLIGEVMSFSCGMFHISMLSTVGEVYTCGFASDGQLGRKWSRRERYLEAGLVNFDHHHCARVIQVACGQRSTLFLMEDGSLLASGVSNDEYGHLGVQTEEVGNNGIVRRPEPVAIDERVERIAAISSDPSIYAAVTEEEHVFTWGEFEFPSKLWGETKLISAFYRAAIPPHLGVVTGPRLTAPWQNAVASTTNSADQSVASRPNANPTTQTNQPIVSRPIDARFSYQLIGSSPNNSTTHSYELIASRTNAHIATFADHPTASSQIVNSPGFRYHLIGPNNPTTDAYRLLGSELIASTATVAVQRIASRTNANPTTQANQPIASRRIANIATRADQDRPLFSNIQKECEANVKDDSKSQELSSILSDLTELHNEVGNLIKSMAPLLEREKASNPSTSTKKNKAK